MLIGSQRVRHDLVTEQYQQSFSLNVVHRMSLDNMCIVFMNLITQHYIWNRYDIFPKSEAAVGVHDILICLQQL